MRGGGDQPGMDEGEETINTPTLKLIMSSFLQKAAVYKHAAPEVHIDGVPDDEEQVGCGSRSKGKCRAC